MSRQRGVRIALSCLIVAVLAALLWFFCPTQHDVAGRPDMARPRPALGALTGEHKGASPTLVSDGSRSPVPRATLMVSVVSEVEGLPVARARLDLSSINSAPLQVECDAMGRASVELPFGETVAVTARARGYERRVVSIESTRDDQRLSIVLPSASGWVRGRVRDTLGAAVPGMRVCAWNFGPFPTLSRLGRAARAGELTEDLTATDGSFALEIGPAGHLWSFAGAGRGFITPTEREVDPGERNWIELKAHPLHAGRVRWSDGDGGPLRVSSALKEGSAPDGRPERGAVVLRAEWSALALLNVDDHELRQVGNDYTLFLFVPEEGRTPETLQVALTKTAPGYEPAQAVIDLPQVTGPIPELDYRLERRTDSFCSVRLRLGDELGIEPTDDDAAGTPFVSSLAGSRQTPAFTIHLKRQGATSSYVFAVWSLSHEFQRLGPVPCGDYELWWTADCGAFAPKVTSVQIDGESITLTVGAKKLGAVELTVHEKPSSLHEGLCVFQVDSLARSRDDPETCFLSFVEAPFVIEGLTPGLYRVRIKHPASLSRVSGREFEIVAGQTNRVELGR